MTVVVDASVAIKWVLDEPGSDQAAALLSQDLIAPSFFGLECAAVLWKVWRRGEIQERQARTKLSQLLEGGVRLREADFADALSLAIELDHPVYDCLYLALARGEGARLATADLRFAAKVEAAQLGVPVMAIRPAPPA